MDVASASQHPLKVVGSAVASTGLSSTPDFDTRSKFLEQPITYAGTFLRLRDQQAKREVTAENQQQEALLSESEIDPPTTQLKENQQVLEVAAESRMPVPRRKDRSLRHRRRNSVTDEVKAQFFHFPAFESPAVENPSVASSLSLRHLTSGGSRCDTLATGETANVPIGLFRHSL
jgi:hypothetical protein